jgi:diketogulonate reductase-like aldo/keto reductase
LRKNFQIFDFHLNDYDMRQLIQYSYQKQARSGWDPTNNDWKQFGPVY